jgi:pimeloyl-ACP methyl ester carboxylesterase
MRTRSLSLVLLIAAVIFLACFAIRDASAQPREEKAPDPEVVTLITRDGLKLKATYYPAPREKNSDATGKQTVPIVMLHDFKSSRNAFDALAKSLQKPIEDGDFRSPGYAVLVPDLRGHGESTKFVSAARRDIEASKMRPQDFMDILEYDLPAIRKFLVTKNDAGELNLNRMCVIGADLGALLAFNWTAQDWSWPDLPVGKQGRDVKAVILISPEWAFKGLRINQALQQPDIRSDRIGMLIMAGDRDSKALAGAKKLHKALARFHPDSEDVKDDKDQTLIFATADTKLRGTRLLTVPGVDFAVGFAKFIQWRAAEPDYPWTARRKGG